MSKRVMVYKIRTANTHTHEVLDEYTILAPDIAGAIKQGRGMLSGLLEPESREMLDVRWLGEAEQP